VSAWSDDRIQAVLVAHHCYLFTDVQSKSNTLAHLTEQLNRLQETLEIKRRIPAQRQNESDLAVSELKLAKAEKELQQVRVLE